MPTVTDHAMKYVDRLNMLIPLCEQYQHQCENSPTVFETDICLELAIKGVSKYECAGIRDGGTYAMCAGYPPIQES